MFEKVIKELKAPVSERNSVPITQVRKWMKSQDVDTLGATYVFLSEAEYIRRILLQHRLYQSSESVC